MRSGCETVSGPYVFYGTHSTNFWLLCGVSSIRPVSYTHLELAEGSLCQVALTDFQISHEFTFLWRKNSAFETELRETSRALWTL